MIQFLILGLSWKVFLSHFWRNTVSSILDWKLFLWAFWKYDPTLSWSAGCLLRNLLMALSNSFTLMTFTKFFSLLFSEFSFLIFERLIIMCLGGKLLQLILFWGYLTFMYLNGHVSPQIWGAAGISRVLPSPPSNTAFSVIIPTSLHRLFQPLPLISLSHPSPSDF